MRINVVGAGISGMLTAYHASKRGHEVHVYDVQNEVAMQCSFANGGQISVCNSKTWNDMATLKKGIKWLFKKDAPLLIRLTPSYRKMKWLSKFVYTTLVKGNKQATVDTIKLGRESSKLMREIIDEEGLQFDQNYRGMMHLYTQEVDWMDAQEDEKTYNENGVHWKNVSSSQVTSIEPTLINFSGLIGGSVIREDWSGDIHKFNMELKKVMQNKYNVKFHLNTSIEHGDELDGITIFANGHQLYDSAKAHGDSFDVYPVKGYSITIELEDEKSQKGAPTYALLDNNKKIVTARMGNRLRVAGTAEFDDVNYDIRRDRVQPLLDWVHENFPDVNTHNYSQWACLRPMTPNMMPIIEQSKTHSNVYYHGGHGHLGWTLSAASAKLICDLVEKNNKF